MVTLRARLGRSAAAYRPREELSDDRGRRPVSDPTTGRRRDWRAIAWFVLLVGAVCFEGLGRKYLPFVPAVVFYFLKDLVLVLGLALYGAPRLVTALARGLYSPFAAVLVVAIAYTVVQMFNPEEASLILAITGLRSYWLWWIAPVVIASALRNPDDRRWAIVILAWIGFLIAAYAWLQYYSPAHASINATTLYEGEQRTRVSMVSTTGRVRVSSTFAYLAGFADFGVLLPTLLLGVALDTRNRATQAISVAAAVFVLAAVGTTGSRMGLGLAFVGLLIVLLTSGFIRTRVGRWAVAVGAVCAVAAMWWGREALQGVQDRWEGADTATRLSNVLLVLPPVALTEIEYPMLGVGTGMQQNARFQLGGNVTQWGTEEEAGRYLVELGAPGYLLVWVARLGLVFALVKMARTLREGGKRGAASAALGYAAVSMFGRLTFDHVWQALYFMGVGLLLGECLSVIEARIRLHSRQHDQSPR